MVSFDEAPYLSKVRRLRALAELVLDAYPIQVKDLDFIKLSANAIFRVVDGLNKGYQLRINPVNYHHKQAVQEEIKWLKHIKTNTNIIVPKPVKTREGLYVNDYYHPRVSAPRLCSLFEWLPGKTRWKTVNESYAYHLGVLIGQLQTSGKRLSLKHRVYWGADQLVGTSKAKFYNIEHLHHVSKKQQDQVTQARRRVHSKLKQYEKSHPNRFGLIHGDMQPNNILYYQGKYAVIDFDDCGMGLFGVDLGTALCAFEHVVEGDNRKSFQSLQAALLQGYEEHMPLTTKDRALLPFFMLSVKLMTIAWLEIRRDNPKIRQYHQVAINRAIQFFKKYIA